MKNKWHAPHPATMYLLFMLLVIFLSWIGDIYDLKVISPQTGEVIRVQNLLGAEGIRWMLRQVQTNFTDFVPLGMAMLAIFGLGIADHSGFINACLRRFMGGHQQVRTIILLVILLGIGSSILGEIGYILLIPLSVYLFKAAHLPPQAGIVVAFVSVTCGFGANLFVTAVDPMLMRYTQEAASLGGIIQNHIGVLANYWFSAASMLLSVGIIYGITRKQLLPYMERNGIVKESDIPYKALSHKENNALRNALIIGAVYLIIIGVATFSPWGILRGVMGDLTRSPFIFGSLFLISFWFGLMGLIYGFGTGRYNTDADVIVDLTKALRLLVDFFVISFFAAQLFAYINYSHLDQCMLVIVGHYFVSLNLTNTILSLCVFILVIAFLNLFVTSGTMKWSLLAYLVIPVLGRIGVAPEVVQAAYRIGDSATTSITPFLIYIPWVLAWIMQYDSHAHFDSLLRFTWRYSVTLLVAWMSLFTVWYLLRIPFGL